MQYEEKYLVQQKFTNYKDWMTLSEHEDDAQAQTELDYQFDMAVREDRPVSLRVIRRSDVTLYMRTKA